MVPVLDKNLVPLMPCKERRARTMMGKGRAKPYWKDGIFCIILQEEPSARNYSDVVVGIDPGSKREGITVATEQRVVLNITSEAITHVKDNVETRRILRRSRRQRKTPYRKCRQNRKNNNKDDKVPPSTKSRWDAKLRILKKLKQILPITDVSVEDVAAKTIKHASKWNNMFSPLETGKTYFYKAIEDLGLNVFKWKGYETHEWRLQAGYKKTSEKLKNVWEAHNVDSHCLCEMVLGYCIKPVKILYLLSFLKVNRRNLFKQTILKRGIRTRYGGTISLCFKKNTLVRHLKYGLSLIGGNTKGRISLHNIRTGKRICQNAKPIDLTIVSYNLKWILQQIVPKIAKASSSHD